MWKSIFAVAAAAYVAAAFTVLSSPSAEATAIAPVPAAAMAANPAKGCEELAWPYNRCSDGRLAARSANVRLITTDRLPR